MNYLSVYFLCQHHNQAHAQVQGGKSAQNSHYHKHNRTKNLTHFFFTPLSANSLRNAFCVSGISKSIIPNRLFFFHRFDTPLTYA